LSTPDVPSSTPHPTPAKVILFSSRARGDANEGSDFGFLIIENNVEDRLAEAVRLAA
jgi:predicted nucleotidyltransferase